MINKKLLVVCLTPFILSVNIGFAADTVASGQQVPAQVQQQEQPQNQENKDAFTAAFGEKQGNSDGMQIMPGQESGGTATEEQALPGQETGGTANSTPTNFDQNAMQNTGIQNSDQQVAQPAASQEINQSIQEPRSNNTVGENINAQNNETNFNQPIGMHEQNQRAGQPVDNGGMLNELFNSNKIASETQQPAMQEPMAQTPILPQAPVETAVSPEIAQPGVPVNAEQSVNTMQQLPAMQEPMAQTPALQQHPAETAVVPEVAQPVAPVNVEQTINPLQQLPAMQEPMAQAPAETAVVPEIAQPAAPVNAERETEKAADIITAQAEQKITEEPVNEIKTDMDDLNKKVEVLGALLTDQKQSDEKLKEQNNTLTMMVGQLLDQQKAAEEVGAKTEKKPAENLDSLVPSIPEGQSEPVKPVDHVIGENASGAEAQIEKPTDNISVESKEKQVEAPDTLKEVSPEKVLPVDSNNKNVEENILDENGNKVSNPKQGELVNTNSDSLKNPEIAKTHESTELQVDGKSPDAKQTMSSESTKEIDNQNIQSDQAIMKILSKVAADVKELKDQNINTKSENTISKQSNESVASEQAEPKGDAKTGGVAPENTVSQAGPVANDATQNKIAVSEQKQSDESVAPQQTEPKGDVKTDEVASEKTVSQTEPVANETVQNKGVVSEQKQSDEPVAPQQIESKGDVKTDEVVSKATNEQSIVEKDLSNEEGVKGEVSPEPMLSKDLKIKDSSEATKKLVESFATIGRINQAVSDLVRSK